MKKIIIAGIIVILVLVTVFFAASGHLRNQIMQKERTMEQDVNRQSVRYLSLMAREYPTIQAVSSEIINLQAICNLPKSTEHFMSPKLR